MRMRSQRVRIGVALSVVTCSAAVLATVSSGGVQGTGAKSAGGQIVMFVPSSANTYVAAWISGAKAEAKKRGYTFKVLENNFDQTEQDTQVQQQLASGDKVVGYVWWPADNRAGIASLRRIARTGVPVVQSNQAPLAESKQFVSAYAGVDDKLNGRVSGGLILKARDALKNAGVKLSSAKGNALLITYAPGYQGAIDRVAGITETLKADGMNIIRTEYSGFTQDDAYKSMSQLYSALKGKGIDVVYTGDDPMSGGVIKALKEAGRTPGKDIAVVSATCKGDLAQVISGEIFGTAIQPPNFEGLLTVNVLDRLIKNGGKTTGRTFIAPSNASAPPTLSGRPAYFNSMPNPGFKGGLGTVAKNKQAVGKVKLWGKTMLQLCNY